MKKMMSLAMIVLFFVSCEGTGDRTTDMPTLSNDGVSDTNDGANMRDSSAIGVQDSSTNTAYDTAQWRRN